MKAHHAVSVFQEAAGTCTAGSSDGQGHQVHLEALGLKREPQLKLVGRKAHEVLGGVVAGGCVEAHRARALQQ